MNHVKITTSDNDSWCGKSLGIDFHFKDAEHAALNGIHGERAVCQECLYLIVKALNSNTQL